MKTSKVVKQAVSPHHVPHPSSKADSSHGTYGFVRSSQRHQEISTTKHHQEARTEGCKSMGGRWRLQKHLRRKVLNRFISDVR
jgi:hypothetical protein